MTCTVVVRYQKEEKTFDNVPLDMTVRSFVDEWMFPDPSQRSSQGFIYQNGKRNVPPGALVKDFAGALRLYDQRSAASRRDLQAAKVEIKKHVTAAVAAGVDRGNAHTTAELDRAVAPVVSAVGEIHTQIVGDDLTPGETDQAYMGRLRIHQRVLQKKR